MPEEVIIRARRRRKPAIASADELSKYFDTLSGGETDDKLRLAHARKVFLETPRAEVKRLARRLVTDMLKPPPLERYSGGDAPSGDGPEGSPPRPRKPPKPVAS